MKLFYIVSLFFPCLALDSGLLACIAVVTTPLYYFRFRWNRFYGYFVISRLIYQLSAFIGVLINAYFIYQGGISIGVILQYAIPIAIDLVLGGSMYMMCENLFKIYNTPYTIFRE